MSLRRLCLSLLAYTLPPPTQRIFHILVGHQRSLQQRLLFVKSTHLFAKDSCQHCRSNKIGTIQMLPQTQYFCISQRSIENICQFSDLNKLKRNRKHFQSTSRNEPLNACPLQNISTKIQEDDDICYILMHNKMPPTPTRGSEWWRKSNDVELQN